MNQLVYFAFIFAVGSSVLGEMDPELRDQIIAERNERHNRLMVHEKYKGPKTCKYSNLSEEIDIPVFYINLNASTSRRKAMEEFYGCLELYRIPAIEFTPESDWLNHPLSSVAGLVGDLEGRSIDPFQRRPQEPYMVEGVQPTYLATIGCLLSHLRAAYIVASLGMPHALILEDDMTPELFPLWSGPPLRELIEGKPFSALQLSILAPTALWEEYYRSLGKSVAGLTGEEWMPSNGAYVLSLGGAVSLRNTFLDFVSLRFKIADLPCVNIDCCVMTFMNDTVTRLPPLFLHSATPPEEEVVPGLSVGSIAREANAGDDDDHDDGGGDSRGAGVKTACEWMHAMGGSTLTCGVPFLRSQQRAVVEQSREGARLLAESRKLLLETDSQHRTPQNHDHNINHDDNEIDLVGTPKAGVKVKAKTKVKPKPKSKSKSEKAKKVAEKDNNRARRRRRRAAKQQDKNTKRNYKFDRELRK